MRRPFFKISKRQDFILISKDDNETNLDDTNETCLNDNIETIQECDLLDIPDARCLSESHQDESLDYMFKFRHTITDDLTTFALNLNNDTIKLILIVSFKNLRIYKLNKI